MTVKHLLLKYRDDSLKGASTMEAHQAVAEGNPNNEFIYGQITQKSGIYSISKQHKVDIEDQLDSGIPTYVYFSRVGDDKVLHRAKLKEIYDRNSPKVVQPAFSRLIPTYYRHLCGETQITSETPSVVYVYFLLQDLELLATGKDEVEKVAQKLLHFAQQQPILTIKGMSAIYYVTDEGLQPHLNRNI